MAESAVTKIEDIVVPAAVVKSEKDVIIDTSPPVVTEKPTKFRVTCSDGHSGTVESLSASGAKYAFMRHLGLCETSQTFEVTPVN